MKLPKTSNPEKYVGLYVIDFGEQCGLGYTAEEVSILLESEEFASVKVYEIHRARPDGSMELAGAARERFFVESGMFFHYADEKTARNDLIMLLSCYDKQLTPCRAKLQLAQREDKQFLIALIYPAEFEHEIGSWLSDSGFRGGGFVDAGCSGVTQYYEGQFDVLERHQLWPEESLMTRDREELLNCIGNVIQR